MISFFLTHVIEIFFRNQPKILKLLLKMHIYASCGVWKFSPLKGWEFAVDEKKRGRVLVVELTSSFEYLRILAFDDFGIDQNEFELELSYLPMELIGAVDCPPVIIANDRQVKNFLTYVRGKASTRLCVSTSPINGNSEDFEVDMKESNSPILLLLAT